MLHAAKGAPRPRRGRVRHLHHRRRNRHGPRAGHRQGRLAELVSLAKIRWRIEHDYRELKHGLGLDHFEGRSWNGWHHHVTLVTAAHAFLTEQRLAPKARTPASPFTRSSMPSKTY
ncbi:transposase [Streptomyces mirabilis]